MSSHTLKGKFRKVHDMRIISSISKFLKLKTGLPVFLFHKFFVFKSYGLVRFCEFYRKIYDFAINVYLKNSCS